MISEFVLAAAGRRQKLRENIVSTILGGEILRVDKFKSQIRTSGLSEIDQTYADGNCYGSLYNSDNYLSNETCGFSGPKHDVKPIGKRTHKRPFGPDDKDKVRISVSARQ